MADIINIEYKSAFSKQSALVWLLCINLLMFVAMRAVAAFGVIGGHEEVVNAMLGAVSLAPQWTAMASHPWTLFTYMVAQYDPSHLLFNMMWLAWFGMFLQHLCGNRIMLLIYLAGGLAGGLAFMLWSGLASVATSDAGLGLLGSSAAVMAVAIAITVIDPDRPIHLLFVGDVKLKWVAAIMIVISVVCFWGYHAGSDVAHAGGAAAGVAAALFIRLRGRSKAARNSAVAVAETPSISAGQTEAISDTELLDTLLDKIRRSGFDSLSAAERDTLFTLSRRLGR